MDNPYSKLVESFSKKINESEAVKKYMTDNNLQGRISDKYHVWINIPFSMGLIWGLHYDTKTTPKEVQDIYTTLFVEAKSESGLA